MLSHICENVDMANIGGDFNRGNDFAKGKGFANRLNRILFPWIGPPPLGPYDQPEPEPVRARGCPLCGAPMDGHTKATVDGRTLLRCP
jgi:hypothetical protein